jgi:para-nitrobenzyl esterase
MNRILAGLAAALALTAPAYSQTNPTAAEARTAAAAAAAPVRVTIDNGVLVGESANGVNYFRGVPFAKPPIGVLRWAPPARPDNWPGERSAVAFEPPCPQPVNIDQRTSNGGGVSGVQSEDCLYLEVTAPANPQRAPVVVWLYGGAGYLGAGHLGSYNGASNAQQNVITVAINYRLGAMANFNHPALTAAAGANTPVGNYALQDAVAALQWVKRNIAQFGGDPNNVTLSGQSAGAAMVVSLLSVPSARGLFHKAIVESGAAIGPGSTLAAIEQRGVAAATALGLPNATAAQLRAVSAQTLVANTATRSGVGSPVDGRFRTTSTIDALNAGTETDVPVMIGSNYGEGGFDAARTVAKLTGDAGAGAWLYNFAYVPSFRSEWREGPIHSGEIMFAFNSLDTSSWATGPNGTVNAADREVARRVNSCWIAFYRMAANARSLSCADGFTWPAYTDAGDDAAQFQATPRVVKSRTIRNGPPQPAAAAPAPAPAAPAPTNR